MRYMTFVVLAGAFNLAAWGGDSSARQAAIELDTIEVQPASFNENTKSASIHATFIAHTKELKAAWPSKHEVVVTLKVDVSLSGAVVQTLNHEEVMTEDLKRSLPDAADFLLTYSINWPLTSPLLEQATVCLDFDFTPRHSQTKVEAAKIASGSSCIIIQTGTGPDPGGLGPRVNDPKPPTATVQFIFPARLRNVTPPPMVSFDPLDFPKSIDAVGVPPSVPISSIQPSPLFLPPPGFFGQQFEDAHVFENPQSSVVTNYRHPAVRCVFSDGETGVARVELIFNGVDLSGLLPSSLEPFTLSTYPTLSLPAGENLWQLRVTDKGGNSTLREAVIIRDETPPVIDELSPDEETIVRVDGGGTFDLGIHFSDDLAGVDVTQPGAVQSFVTTEATSGDLVSVFGAIVSEDSIVASLNAAEVLTKVSNAANSITSSGRVVVQLGLRDRVDNTAFVQFSFYVSEVPEDIIQAINARLEGLSAAAGVPVTSQIRHLATVEDALLRVLQLASVDGFIDEKTGAQVLHKTFFTDNRFYPELLEGEDYDSLFGQGGTQGVNQVAVQKHAALKVSNLQERLLKMRNTLNGHVRWVQVSPAFQSGATCHASMSGQAECKNETVFNQAANGTGESFSTTSVASAAVQCDKVSQNPPMYDTFAGYGYSLQSIDLTALKKSAAVVEATTARAVLFTVVQAPSQSVDFAVGLGSGAPPSPSATAQELWAFANSLTPGPQDTVPSAPSGSVDSFVSSQVGSNLLAAGAQLNVAIQLKKVLPTTISLTDQTETGSVAVNNFKVILALQFVGMPMQALSPTGNTTIDSDAPSVIVSGSFVQYDSAGKITDVIADGSAVRFKCSRNGSPAAALVHVDPSLALDPSEELVASSAAGSASVALDLTKILQAQIALEDDNPAKYKPGDIFTVTAQLESISNPAGPAKQVLSATVLESGAIHFLPGRPLFAGLVGGSELQQTPKELKGIFATPAPGTVPAPPLPKVAADNASVIPVKAVAYDRYKFIVNRPQFPVRWIADGNFSILNEDPFLNTRGEAHAVVRAGEDPTDPLKNRNWRVRVSFGANLDAEGLAKEIGFTQDVIQMPLQLTISPIIDPLKIGINDFREVTITAQATDGVSSAPVADGAAVAWYTSLGTIVAEERSPSGALNEGFIRNGTAKARLTTATVSPYDANSDSFEKAQDSDQDPVYVSAFVASAQTSTTTKFVWPLNSPLTVSGTPVLLGDLPGATLLPIITGSDPDAPDGLKRELLLAEVAATITVTGPPGHLLKVGLEDNYVSRLLYEMEELGLAGEVPDSALANTGTGTDVVLDGSLSKKGASSYKFNGSTSKIVVPLSAPLQITEGLVINLFARIEEAGQAAVLVRSGEDWIVSVDSAGFVYFSVNAGNKTLILKSLVALPPNVWARVQARRLESGDLELAVNGVLTVDKGNKKAINLTSQQIEIGAGFKGNLDHLEIATTLDALLTLQSGDTVKLDSSGLGTVTVVATGALTGRKMTMRAVFVVLTGSPTVKKPVAVTTSDIWTNVASYGKGVMGDPKSALLLILDFTIIGDIKDLVQFMIDILPGGDSPNYLVGAVAVFSLVTEFLPLFKPFGDLAKRAVKLSADATKVKKFG